MGELDPKIKIRAPLRCDGIGRLDCAEDTESGSRLAVRWLPLEANGDAAAKACEKLPPHPTLPRIRQTGAVGTSAFVAMDFPEGQVLSALVEDRLDIDVVIRIASQVSDALALVHDQGVIHGELSTESILVVQPDRAYLWDMPLVIANRLTDRRGENRLMQNLPRTAAYLSPERAQGSGSSMAGDVYSLGAVLCAVAGAPLPTSQTTLGVVHLVASGQWAPRVPTTIPDPWRSMILRMVSTNPSERPSAREVSLAFSKPPAPAMLPTVPEMPAVRLPPELMAAAEAMARKPIVIEASEPGAAAAADAAVVADVSTTPSAPETVSTAETVQVAALVPTSSTPSSEATPAVRADSQEVPEVSGTDVVKLPTIEMPLVQVQALVNQTHVAQGSGVMVTEMVVPPAPRLTPMAVTAVKLADNIMVSPELANAGAVTLTAEEFAQLQRPAKWVYALGGVMAAAIIILLAVAVHLAAKQGAQQELAQQPAVNVPAVTRPAENVPQTPTPVNVSADEELAPLRPRTAVKKPAPRQEQGFDMPERSNL